MEFLSHCEKTQAYQNRIFFELHHLTFLPSIAIFVIQNFELGERYRVFDKGFVFANYALE